MVSAIEEVLQTMARQDVVVQARRLADQGQTALAMAVTRDELRLARNLGDVEGVREMIGLLREMRRHHAARRDAAHLALAASGSAGGTIPSPRAVSTPVAAAWQFG